MPEDIVVSNLQTAAEALEQAQTLPPFQLTHQAKVATRAVSRARDILIERLRQAGDGTPSTAERLLLDEVNAILSQVIAIQSPAAGVNRQEITKTRDALDDIIRVHTSRLLP
jgi:hypothetical protein